MKKLFEKLYKDSAESFYKKIKNNLKKNKKTFIVTANPETFMKSETDDELNILLNDEDTILVPDGIGIVKATRMLDYDIKERIAGIDIAVKLLEYGNELKKSIYLFGAKQEVIDAMKEVFEEKYPNLEIKGTSNGYEKNKDKIFNKISKLQPDIVLVALGIPAQEKIIYKHLSKFNKGIFVGVGGSFDVISGTKKRAPKIFIKLNLEWLYRILKEPKRLKRFYDSNVKFLLKVKKKNLSNICFIGIIFFYLLIGMFMSCLGLKSINNYENRMANKIYIPTISDIKNSKFQDDIELVFADQTPMSTVMKKGYNFLNNSLTSGLYRIFLKNTASNRYVNLGNSIVLYGSNENIVYYESYINYSKDDYDNRINNINNTINNVNIPVFIYYVEKDTDINFESNKKTDIYDYLKNNIKTDNVYKYSIDSFEEFENKFYKTDHHWNYKGSYEAYNQLVDILTDDEPLTFKKEICLNDNFSGSKANYSGASLIYKEKFCVYQFDFPDIYTMINGKEKEYGNQDYHIKNPTKDVSYGSFYGYDDGEIIFDTGDNSKENILVIGESYDNAILKLLSTHFNKTFSIDLRNYERENEKKFAFYDYIKNNDIDKILLIGNRDFFIMNEFNLEG